MSRPAPAPSPGAILFFVLLGVTLAAAALVVRARTPDLALEVVEISPRELTVADDEDARARIAFFVRKSDPAAEVGIVDRDERPVRALAGPVGLEAGERRAYIWDARSDAGELVPSGRYRLRVRLRERDRDMIWPRPIIVDREPVEPHGRRERVP